MIEIIKKYKTLKLMMFIGECLAVCLMLFSLTRDEMIFKYVIFIAGIGLMIFSRKELDYYYQIKLFETVEEKYERRITKRAKAG